MKNLKVKAVEVRRRDIVIRIADWTKDKDCPTFDLEIYSNGKYLDKVSSSFTLDEIMDRKMAWTAMIIYLGKYLNKEGRR